MIQKSGNKVGKKIISVVSGPGCLTFLLFLCFLGGGKDRSLSQKWMDTRKSSSPHRSPKTVSIAQEGLEFCQVAIRLFREKRGFSIV